MKPEEECRECGGVVLHSDDCSIGKREQREDDDDQGDEDDDQGDQGDEENEGAYHDEDCSGCEACS